MRTGAVPSNEIFAEGCRLTGAYHLSEDQVAVSTLKRSKLPKVPLQSQVRGRGIFRGPIFSRRYVEDPVLGEPYVSAKDLVTASVRPSAYLSRSHGELLNELRLRQGMVLITCSGMNLGRAIWGRQDLDGLVGSHDLIRVCPNGDVVPPGYLHAFLSGRYGHGFIRKQIYGGNIKHIEPAHLANLPVPRIGDEAEGEAHRLVDLAASNRTKAIHLLKASLNAVDDLLNAAGSGSQSDAPWSPVAASRLQSRCDAYYYSIKCEAARRAFDGATVPEHRTLGEVAQVFIPGIFKRRYADDPAFGVPYITGGDVFQLAPTSDRFLMDRVAQDNQLVIKKGMFLIQEAGQLGGLIGKSVFVGDHLDGYAVSNNMVRVTARDERDAGYLFALLSTNAGVTLIAREAAGSSIPHMDANRIRSLSLPWPGAAQRHEISRTVVDAIALRDRAAEAEDEARALVERAIEEAA
jgi:type I restriction enzyme S subunit